jgi:N-acetyl-gamma-glutamyl-phosphate reductase
MPIQVFIDGEAGTTGLQVRDRLSARSDISLLALPDALRKDAAARREALNDADIVILCLPDDAARDAVSMIENPRTRVIDASTAHRTAPGWVFGFPEFRHGNRDAIRNAARVSNPGCYSTGFIAMVAPLVAAGLIPADAFLTCNAVSGYSGGGKSMIAEFEDPASPNFTAANGRTYALALQHKHVSEMQRHCGLKHRPLFAPSVGRYFKGMLVDVPLQLDALPGAPSIEQLHEALGEHYQGELFVEVASIEAARAATTIDPETLNDTNSLRIMACGAPETRQARLIAILDNLGKGASGAAVQSLNLMADLPEDAGLSQAPRL